MRSEAVALSADWVPKVSVFWTDRHFILGRFPLLDRIDYLDHAVVLVEHGCVRPARPSLEEIRHYLRGAPFANWADRARSFAAADTLSPKDQKEYLRTPDEAVLIANTRTGRAMFFSSFSPRSAKPSLRRSRTWR